MGYTSSYFLRLLPQIIKITRLRYCKSCVGALFIDVAHLPARSLSLGVDIVNNSQRNNRTLDNLLYIGVHASKVHDVVQQTNDKRTDDGAARRTNTACKARAADNRRCQRLRFISLRAIRKASIYT